MQAFKATISGPKFPPKIIQIKSLFQCFYYKDFFFSNEYNVTELGSVRFSGVGPSCLGHGIFIPVGVGWGKQFQPEGGGVEGAQAAEGGWGRYPRVSSSSGRRTSCPGGNIKWCTINIYPKN